jgi:hypothetical protein
MRPASLPQMQPATDNAAMPVQHSGAELSANGGSGINGDTPPNLRSALGLIALMRLYGIGWTIALRMALFCPTIAPHVDKHRDEWEKALESARGEMELCREAGVAVVSIFDKAYPERLRTLPYPPPVLYVQGEAGLLNQARTVVLTGAAEQTPSGTAATERIATVLAQGDWTLASSMTLGVEASARKSAHAVNAATVALIGWGLKAPVSAVKQEFAEEVLSLGGALVSAEPLEKAGGADADMNARGLAAGLSAATIVPDARLTDFMRRAIQTAVLQGRPVICVKPSANDDIDDESSTRPLLGVPAKELLKMGSSWRDRRFAAALDDRPLAEEAPEDPYDLVSRLQRAVDAELRDPLPPRWWFGLEQRNGPPLDAHAATRLLRADAGF